MTYLEFITARIASQSLERVEFDQRFTASMAKLARGSIQDALRCMDDRPPTEQIDPTLRGRLNYALNELPVRRRKLLRAKGAGV